MIKLLKGMDQSAAVCYAYAIPPLRNRHSTYFWIKKDEGMKQPRPLKKQGKYVGLEAKKQREDNV